MYQLLVNILNRVNLSQKTKKIGKNLNISELGRK
jgi:hypothetical protein